MRASCNEASGSTASILDCANQLDSDTGLAHTHFVGQHYPVFANSIGQRMQAGSLAWIQMRSRLTCVICKLLLLHRPLTQ